MKSQQTRIIDIAKALNISKSTVSRALTGHPEVKSETRKLVLELAAQLEYQPNLLSINLIKNKTNLIGMIVPEFTTSFFPQVVKGAQKVATKAGFNLIISQSDENYETEVANAKVMLANRVDGLLISLSKETRNYDHLKVYQRKNIPIVFFNRVCQEMIVPKVVINDYNASFKAVEHLIQTGKKKIAHLAGPDTLVVSRNRLNGYLDALRKYELPVDESLILPYDVTYKKVKTCLNELLSLNNPPDALFTINDSYAIEAIQTVKAMGLKIPEDIAIVGFSNDYGSDFIEPGLTTVDQPKQLIGSTAMEMLLKLIDVNPADRKAVTVTLDTELIIRKSSQQ